MVGFPKVNGAGDKQPVVDAKSAGTVNEPGDTTDLKNIHGSIVRIFDGDAVYNDTLCQVHVDSATGTITGSDRRSSSDEDVVPNFVITIQEITNAKGEKAMAPVYTNASGESWILPPRTRIQMADGKTMIDVYCEGEGADFRMRAQISNRGPTKQDDGYGAVISDIGSGDPFTNGGTVDGVLGDGKRMQEQYSWYRFEEAHPPGSPGNGPKAGEPALAGPYGHAFREGGIEGGQATPGWKDNIRGLAEEHGRVADIIAHPVTHATEPQDTHAFFRDDEWASMDETYFQIDTPPGVDVPRKQPIAAEAGAASNASTAPAPAGRAGPAAGGGGRRPVDEEVTSMSFGDYLDQRRFPPAAHAAAPPPAQDEEPERRD